MTSSLAPDPCIGPFKIFRRSLAEEILNLGVQEGETLIADLNEEKHYCFYQERKQSKGKPSESKSK